MQENQCFSSFVLLDASSEHFELFFFFLLLVYHHHYNCNCCHSPNCSQTLSKKNLPCMHFPLSFWLVTSLFQSGYLQLHLHIFSFLCQFTCPAILSTIYPESSLYNMTNPIAFTRELFRLIFSTGTTPTIHCLFYTCC